MQLEFYLKVPGVLRTAAAIPSTEICPITTEQFEEYARLSESEPEAGVDAELLREPSTDEYILAVYLILGPNMINYLTPFKVARKS